MTLYIFACSYLNHTDTSVHQLGCFTYLVENISGIVYRRNPILHGLFWAGWSREGGGGMESTTPL